MNHTICSETRRRWIALLVAILVCLSPSFAAAQQREEVPPLTENFSPAELTLTGLVVAASLPLTFAGPEIFGDPIPSMGPPDPRSIDWRYSEHVTPEGSFDPDSQWLGGVPDYAGYVLPAAAFAYYATGTIGAGISDDFFLRDQKHELLAFTEAFSWTMVVVNGLKLIVGRRRPFAVRPDINPDAVGESESERFLSFPSGHSASAAVTSFFIFHDLSDHLFAHTFADAHPVVRWTVGRGVPLVGAAGLTWMVMYSRMRDQRHWLSDTLVGAGIGLAFSSFFYTLHFDDEGNPRRRHVDEESDTAGSALQHNIHPMVGLRAAQQQSAPVGLTYRLVF